MSTPTLSERLTAYIASRYPSHVADSMGKPWTFHYRQWTNDVGDRCAQVTGVTIETHDGKTYTHSVSDMDVAAQERYA